MDLLKQNLDEGLHPDTHANANVKCFPTYVRSVPDGSGEAAKAVTDVSGTWLKIHSILLPSD